eukprot:15281981-Alexandrium_andersonii.AAC.1
MQQPWSRGRGRHSTSSAHPAGPREARRRQPCVNARRAEKPCVPARVAMTRASCQRAPCGHAAR